MEDLINQMRSKLSGGGQAQVTWSSSSFPRDRRIPPQKSLSFKGEKKSSNWFQRQLSRQMSGSGSGTEDELAAVAVAAAAFAVRNTLREFTSTTRNTTAEREPGTSLAKPKSRKDREPQSPPPTLEPVRSSLRFSESPENRASTAPTTPSRDLTLQRRTTFADQLEETEPPKPETPPPPKPLKPFPSMKKLPSLVDKKTQVEPSTMKKPDTPSPRPAVFPPIKQVTPSPAATQKPRASRGDSAADAWEKAEMERIKERYDKLSSTILSWEQDKKKKARAKLDRAESEPQKRSKALQKFKEEMEQINEITGGARAQAEERRRNEELKIREKANKYRATGKLPRTCFCF